MPRETEEFNQTQYQKLLTHLNPKEVSVAKKAWAQIIRYQKSSPPTSVITLFFFASYLVAAYHEVGMSEKLIPWLLGVPLFYFAHWFFYRGLRRQRDQAQQLILRLQKSANLQCR